jgi:diguanylate cyclase (GGDEF)-like protein
VLVPQPVSEVRASIMAGRESASLVFSAGLALSALVALTAAALITRPLRAVAKAADKMARGAEGIVVGPLPRGAPSELHALSTAFNKMARRIEGTLTRITMLAGQDPTTGLLNKRSFEETAQTWLRTAHSDTRFSLLHVDMNNLKRINDVYGHAAGDEAIRGIARRLESVFPAPALVARVGGDEFLVLTVSDELTSLRRRLSPIIEGQSLALSGGQTTSVSCSVGIAETQPGAADIDLLINQADEAMYHAKKRASGLQVYDQEMRSRTHRRLALSSQLRQDVAADRIEAVFQPIFCARSGDIVAFEALARWRAEGIGIVRPGEFLCVAHDAGILSDLDRRVRRQAFAFASDLRERGAGVPVAINVTAPDLARADFAERFHADLHAAGLEGRDVIVEVTETVFHDPCGLAIRTLGQLSDDGVAIQLDDFGKGFSSHGLLPLCSFQAVKIDLHFAGDPSSDPKAGAIVGSLARLGSELGLAVTLEGIETEQDRAFARAQGVERLQGYLYAYPLDRTRAMAAAQTPGRLSVAV